MFAAGEDEVCRFGMGNEQPGFESRQKEAICAASLARSAQTSSSRQEPDDESAHDSPSKADGASDSQGSRDDATLLLAKTALCFHQEADSTACLPFPPSPHAPSFGTSEARNETNHSTFLECTPDSSSAGSNSTQGSSTGPLNAVQPQDVLKVLQQSPPEAMEGSIAGLLKALEAMDDQKVHQQITADEKTAALLALAKPQEAQDQVEGVGGSLPAAEAALRVEDCGPVKRAELSSVAKEGPQGHDIGHKAFQAFLLT